MVVANTVIGRFVQPYHNPFPPHTDSRQKSGYEWKWHCERFGGWARICKHNAVTVGRLAFHLVLWLRPTHITINKSTIRAYNTNFYSSPTHFQEPLSYYTISCPFNRPPARWSQQIIDSITVSVMVVLPVKQRRGCGMIVSQQVLCPKKGGRSSPPSIMDLAARRLGILCSSFSSRQTRHVRESLQLFVIQLRV